MEILLGLIILFPLFMMAVVIHEVSHGWVALGLGDTTALRAGRLTLNPFRHIDPIGTIVLPLFLTAIGAPFVFGWAKPVPVNPFELRHPRRDMMWVGIAGPIANFLLAGCGAALLHLSKATAPTWLVSMLGYFTGINVVLGTFNLLPIPPLDGSRVLTGLVPLRMAKGLIALERWGVLILFVLLYLGIVHRILNPVVAALMKFFGVNV